MAVVGVGVGMGVKSFFLCEQRPHLLEHFAAMPVGKFEMGFIDITAKTFLFWTLLKGTIARLQAVVMKNCIFPLRQHNYCCSFFTLTEKRGYLTLRLLKYIYIYIYEIYIFPRERE